MYVTNVVDDTVVTIDTKTDTLVGNPIPVGDGPNAIAYNPDNKKMYVTNINDDNVLTIDTETDTVVGNPIILPSFSLPQTITYDPDNKKMYVTTQGANIQVIDTKTDSLSNPIILQGFLPYALYDADNKLFFVLNSLADVIVTIDTNTDTIVGNPIQFNQNIFAMALNPVNKLIYVTNNDAGAILTLNSDTKIVVGSPIPVGDNPLTVLFNPDDTNMYVTANFS
jgi:YVTN family beta-propeller protein